MALEVHDGFLPLSHAGVFQGTRINRTVKLSSILPTFTGGTGDPFSPYLIRHMQRSMHDVGVFQESSQTGLPRLVVDHLTKFPWDGYITKRRKAVMITFLAK